MAKEQVKSTRQSNFELLRIISMLLVVATHANFYSLGWPSSVDFAAAPSNTVIKLLFESFSICCVDVFVLISGWFGIRPSLRKFARLLFQCLFFSFGILIIVLLSHKAQIGMPLSKEIMKSLFLRDYWFITSYILLYLLAPVLNAFLESASQKTLLVTVVGFFLFEFVYGWFYSINGFNRGCSTISFFGLYLLAGYIRRFPHPITRLKPSVYFLVFVCLCLLNTVFCAVMLKTGHVIDKFYYYTSPAVILISVSLLLCFSKLEFYNKAINYIASSALAVYLLHQNHFVYPEFQRIAIQLFNNNGPALYSVKILLFILSVFILAVLIDQIRKALDHVFFSRWSDRKK